MQHAGEELDKVSDGFNAPFGTRNRRPRRRGIDNLSQRMAHRVMHFGKAKRYRHRSYHVLQFSHSVSGTWFATGLPLWTIRTWSTRCAGSEDVGSPLSILT